MKRIISLALVCVLLVGVVFALASCGSLSGTYTYEQNGMKMSYKFSGKNVSMITEIGDEKYTIEGTYELNDDETKITVTPDADSVKTYLVDMGMIEDADDISDEDLQEFIDEIAEEQSFEKGDGFVKIGGMKFDKQ